MSGRARLALLALCVALRVVSLVRPCLSDDEAIYAVVAREMLSGHELYRDVVDHKPPAIYVVYAATQAVAGPRGGMLVLHALLIAWVFATALVLARIVRRHWPGTDPRAPAAAALLWVVATTTLVDVDALAANCELFMLLPLAGGVAVFLDARGQLGRLAVAGALLGIACLFKYQAAIQLPVLAGAALCGWHDRGAARRLAAAVALGLGFALPLAGAVLASWRGGGLADAVFWLRFNFAYIEAGSSWGELVVRLVARGGLVVGSAALLYALAAATMVAARRDPLVRLVTGWALASAIAVFVGGRFFGHYFHQLAAPLAVLAAPATVRLWDRRPTVVALALGVPAAGYLALGALHDRVMVAWGEPDPPYRRVVAWLDHRGPGALCVWGNSPVLYFEAERPLGCRFVFANYLTGASPATATQRDPAVDSSAGIVAEAWPMLVRDLEDRRPRFVVDGSPGDVAFYGKYPPRDFPLLARILACDYDATVEVAGMRVFERRAISRCTATARAP